MDLTNFTTAGTLHCDPPIDHSIWNEVARSSLFGRLLALVDSTHPSANDRENATAVFSPEIDRHGIRKITVHDRGTSLAVTARLATFVAEWVHTRSGEARTFTGRVDGTGPYGERTLWGVDESRILDLRLDQPGGLLGLIELHARDFIGWLSRQDETNPYTVPAVDEAASLFAAELATLCPGLGGLLDDDALTGAQCADDRAKEQYEQACESPATKGAWVAAAVTAVLGLGEAWTARLAAAADDCGIEGAVSDLATQARVLTTDRSTD